MRSRIAAKLRSPKNKSRKEKSKSKSKSKGKNKNATSTSPSTSKRRVRTRTRRRVRVSSATTSCEGEYEYGYGTQETHSGVGSGESDDALPSSSSPSRAPRSLPTPPPSLASLPLSPLPHALPLTSGLGHALGLEHASAARKARPSLASLSLPPHPDSFAPLIHAAAWGEVLALSHVLLDPARVADLSPVSIVNVRTLRCLALLKLGMVARAEAEARPLLGHELRALASYQSYPELYPDKTGSFLPYLLRVVGFVLHFLQGNPDDAFRDATEVLEWVRAHNPVHTPNPVAPNPSEEAVSDAHVLDLVSLDMGIDAQLAAASAVAADGDVWAFREIATLLTMISMHVRMGDTLAGIALFQSTLYPLRPDEPGLLGLLGRMYLSVGHVGAAACVFAKVEELAGPFAPSGDPEDVPSVHVNRGYVAIAQTQHAAAALCFQRALDLYVAHEKASGGATKWSESAKASAANNRAVAWLHDGKLDKATKSLENIVHASPACTVNPTIIANLTLLHELSGGSVSSAKSALARMVAEHAGDDFDINALRLSTLSLNQ